VVLAQLDACTVLAGATEQHIRQLEGHRDKALGVLSDEGARIVAAGKEAAGDAGALAALRAELARAIRL
jgi:hypothetical protein